jgi:hypothetical protein
VAAAAAAAAAEAAEAAVLEIHIEIISQHVPEQS